MRKFAWTVKRSTRGDFEMTKEEIAPPQWIKNDPMALIYDGSIFAVALTVRDTRTKKESWWIDVISITADEDIFYMHYVVDGENTESYTEWGWDDFEFVIPMNDSAKQTVKEFNHDRQ